MRLSAEERETIILWSDADETASIYTHDKKLISRLKELAKKYPQQIYLDEKNHPGAVTYIVPKRCVSIHSPYTRKRCEDLSRKIKELGCQPPARKTE